MTRLPTDTAIGHLFDGLRALDRRRAAGYPKLIDDLEQRLLTAVRRDRTGSVIPDGYPVSTGGGGGGSGDSSTERCALALTDRPPRDRHYELTARAVQQLDTAVTALQHMRAALNSIDDLTADGKPTKDEPRTCSHCTGKRGKSGNRPIHATGTIGDRVDRPIALCKACYGFVERTAKAGTRDGYLPSDQQIRDHEERGKWRIRAVARVER